MGWIKSIIDNPVIATRIGSIAVILYTLVAIPNPVNAMGSSYEDCAGQNMKKINTTATQSLSLTQNIKYEARKYPTRLSKTITALDQLESDLTRVKSMTAYRSKTYDYAVRSEMDRYKRDEFIQRNEVDNIMETLFGVFRESIQQQNADKEYWLNKLSEMNKMGEALGDYLAELNDAARSLVEECDEPEKPVQMQKQQIIDEPVIRR